MINISVTEAKFQFDNIGDVQITYFQNQFAVKFRIPCSNQYKSYARIFALSQNYCYSIYNIILYKVKGLSNR